MIGFVKATVKALPHPVLLRTYHAWYIRHEEAQIRRASALSGIPMLKHHDLSQLKSSETVFLFGSGPSINDISDERWTLIRKHDTIGFNWWPLHRFVPKIYVYESLQTNSPLYACFMEMFRRRAQDYRDTVKIINAVEDIDFRGQLIYEAPEEFKAKTYVAPIVPVVARNVDELGRGLRFVQRMGGFSLRRSIPWLFKYGGSVTATIDLALHIGYKRIVLCGIDLGPQEYFYQNPKLYPESAKWEFVPKNQPHLTTRQLEYLVPAQQVIWSMNEEILQPRSVELLVENSSSTLFPRLPKFED